MEKDGLRRFLSVTDKMFRQAEVDLGLEWSDEKVERLKRDNAQHYAEGIIQIRSAMGVEHLSGLQTDQLIADLIGDVDDALNVIRHVYQKAAQENR